MLELLNGVKLVNDLKSEKETLDQVLNMKVNDVQDSILNEKKWIEDEIWRGFDEQDKEKGRMKVSISQLQEEQQLMSSSVLAL